jgi:hypothetical protein
MSTQSGFWFSSLLVGVVMLPVPAMAGPGLAQIPIAPLSGTIGLPANIDKFYSNLNKALVAAGDGIEHVKRSTPETKTRGNDASLESLEPGTVVVVHYTVKGIQASADEIERVGPNGSSVNEGVVTRVDRFAKRITIRFADGATETLRLERKTVEGASTHSLAVVSYSDGSGRKMVRYFKLAAS